jgi:hypothetical protein
LPPDIEDFPQFTMGIVALTPTGAAYQYAPTQPSGLVPPLAPPPTIEGYPPMSTNGLAIAPDGGVWLYQPTQPGQMTEVVPSARPPVNTIPPVTSILSGGGDVGSLLVNSPGTWIPPATSYTRQWQSNGVNIPGATATSYTVQASDVGNLIRVVVTGINASGSGTANSNTVGPITMAPPVNSVLPAITGTPEVGATLTCSPGTWAHNPSYAYQWWQMYYITDVPGDANSSAISGATTNTLVIPAPLGTWCVACVVTATNAAGSATATAPTRGPISAADEEEDVFDDNGGAQSRSLNEKPTKPKPTKKPSKTAKPKRV